MFTNTLEQRPNGLHDRTHHLEFLGHPHRHRHGRRQEEANPEDFTPAPGGYFVLAAITPLLVLPIYFFASRRSSTIRGRAFAAFGGLALTIACYVVASVLAAIAVLIFRA